MMTKEDLKEEYKNISEDQFIPSVRYPECLAYNLSGQIKNIKTGCIYKNFTYFKRNGLSSVRLREDTRYIESILRDIAEIFYNGNITYKTKFYVKEELPGVIPWSNIEIIEYKFCPLIWTEQAIKDYIKENNIKSQAELCRVKSGAVDSARKLGILKDLFPPRPLRIDPDARINWVYAYFSKTSKTVYIGRTFSKTRDWDHRNEKIHDSVYTGFEKLGEEIPKWTILENNLKLLESAEREKWWMQYYQDMGYTLLNKIKGGGLGNLTAITLEESKEHCKQVALQYTTIQEFHNNNWSEWKKSKRNGWFKTYTWLEDASKWTNEKIFKLAEEYTCYTDFRKENRGAYSYVHRHQLYDQIKQIINNNGN